MGSETFLIRETTPRDAPAIPGLIAQLAEAEGHTTPLTPEYVIQALGNPALLFLSAEAGGKLAGLLCATIRPNLYHAADAGLVDELVVDRAWRGRGIGRALLDEFLARMAARGCAEVGIGVLFSNTGAQKLYRAAGFREEVLLLERHFDR